MSNIVIDHLSTLSLKLELFYNDTYLSSGTGFLIKSNLGKNYLITNYHVLSGRRFDTGKCLSAKAAIPNKLKVWQHLEGYLGNWFLKEYELVNGKGENQWKEIRYLDKLIDVAFLLIEGDENVKFNYLDINLAKQDITIAPSEVVSIIGFPYGKSSDGKFPIWKTGHIASDYDLNYENKPIFLIDATTKEGMSGSPVFIYRKGCYKTSTGWVLNGVATRFLGIYSGRITGNDDRDIPDIGIVWKPEVLSEVMKN